MRPAVQLAVFALGIATATGAAPVPAGAYTVDKAHTSLIFRVNHLGFSSWTGRFTRFDAQLSFNPAKLEASSVNVTIDPASIESDNAPSGFLQTLAGKDWLDAAHYPDMTFQTKGVEVTGKDTFRIQGELTLHGISRPVVLEARYNGGYAGHPFDPRARTGFSAHGSFKRSDFGVSYGIPAPGTTLGVGDQVDVIIETEFNGPPALLAPGG